MYLGVCILISNGHQDTPHSRTVKYHVLKQQQRFRQPFEDQHVWEVGNCGNGEEHLKEDHHWEQGCHNQAGQEGENGLYHGGYPPCLQCCK